MHSNIPRSNTSNGFLHKKTPSTFNKSISGSIPLPNISKLSQETDPRVQKLKKELEGKSTMEVKNAIEAFKTEQAEANKNLTTKEDLVAAQKELNDGIKAVQDHLNTLDVKMKAKEVKEVKGGDPLKDLIVKNFDVIKEVVRKKNVFVEDTKVVGNMTLGTNLSGDQPRTFASDVATVPNQILNFSELIGVVTYGTPVSSSCNCGASIPS